MSEGKRGGEYTVGSRGFVYSPAYSVLVRFPDREEQQLLARWIDLTKRTVKGGVQYAAIAFIKADLKRLEGGKTHR